MKLKAIYRKWSAGRPIVILNEKDAKKIGAEVNNRVVIKHKNNNCACEYFTQNCKRG